ncbi:MAG TPA: carboxypeptidase-like regulatory domain-containing protein, partial [Polyangiales bacterium]|nr:carboxypeptidase-like regulatory domain-containing protein [Polyangiales bacterium]
AVPGGTAGAASGTVQNSSGGPVSGATVVALDASGNVANTTNTDQNGNFTLHTISAGTYQLEIYNTYTTAVGQTNTASGNDNTSASLQGPSVTVTAGQTTAIGTIAD